MVGMIIRECSDRAHKSEPGRNRKGRRIPPEPDYGDSTQPAGNASSTIETYLGRNCEMELGYSAHWQWEDLYSDALMRGPLAIY